MSKQGQRLIAAIRAVAAEQPDHVHNGHCLYVQRTLTGVKKPGCLVGHGLWRTGLIDESMYALPNNVQGVEALQHELGLSNIEIAWLATVQAAQDARYLWGVAVEYADQQVPEVLTMEVPELTTV